MNVRLQSITPDAEREIVEIARVSSSRENKREEPAKLIRYLIQNQHWSPFEHGFMTVEIRTSRAIATQFLRHRSFTFQQFSLRYAEAPGMEPIEMRLQAEKNRQSSTDVVGYIESNDYGFHGPIEVHSAIIRAYEAMRETFKAYEALLEVGIARECARFILPMATETTLYMTGPVRSWIHMIQLRDDEHAQKEARLIAQEVKAIFAQQFPIIAEALEWKTEDKRY